MTRSFLSCHMLDAYFPRPPSEQVDALFLLCKVPYLMTAVAPEDQPLCGQKRRRRAIEEEHSTVTTPPLWKRAKRHRQSQQKTDTAYWDSLSKLWLTRRALDELDRRNRQRASPVERNGDKPRQLRSLSKQLKSFTQNGGPDLCNLRGVSWTYENPDRCSFPPFSIQNARHRTPLPTSCRRISLVAVPNRSPGIPWATLLRKLQPRKQKKPPHTIATLGNTLSIIASTRMTMNFPTGGNLRDQTMRTRSLTD